jgi:diacylglycerol kinase family enzyme
MRSRACGKYEVIVVAGGDGTFSDVINAIDTSRTPVAYLPLGSGNAMSMPWDTRVPAK